MYEQLLAYSYTTWPTAVNTRTLLNLERRGLAKFDRPRILSINP